MATENRVGWRAMHAAGHGPALALVSLGVWLHAADSLLVATMLPAITEEIGGVALVPWTLALYELGTIVAGAAGGLTAARLGLRGPMAGAALLFGFGCALAALAPSMPVLLSGRLLQGLGGGGLMALSFVAVSALFPARFLAMAMAAISALWGTASFLGPLIGGLFVAAGSWRGGFWFFAAQALGLALWIAFGARLERAAATGSGQGGFPGLRLALIAAGVLLVATAGIVAQPLLAGTLVLAALATLWLALRLDARMGDARILPRQPFRPDSAVGSALLLVLCFSMATTALAIYGPLLFVRLHGVSALTAGYLVAAASVGWTAAALAVARSPERFDPVWIAIGFTMVCATIPLFLRIVPTGPLWAIGAVAAMEGAGFGLAWTFVLRRMTALAPADETARIASALPTVQRLGYALGAAWLGIVANAAGLDEAPDATAGAARALFLACLPFGLVGLAATARFVAPWRKT